MNPFKTVLSNLCKGWKTTLLGSILLIACIASVFLVDSVTWTDAAIPVVLSVLLLIAPQGLRKALLGFLAGKGGALVLYIGLTFTVMSMISCNSSKPVAETVQTTQIISTKTTEAIVKHHFQADSTQFTINPSEMEVDKPYKSESTHTAVTVTKDAWGDLKVKAESKERIVRDTARFIQTDTLEVATPCILTHVDPNAKSSDTGSPSGWIWRNIVWPAGLLVLSALVLLLVVAFIRELFRSMFSKQAKQ